MAYGPLHGQGNEIRGPRNLRSRKETDLLAQNKQALTILGNLNFLSRQDQDLTPY